MSGYRVQILHLIPPASSNGTQNSNANRREAVLPLKSKWKWYLAVVMWEEFCGRETWCWWRWHRKCEMGWRACDAICLFRRQKYTENADVSDTSVRSSTHTHAAVESDHTAAVIIWLEHKIDESSFSVQLNSSQFVLYCCVSIYIVFCVPVRLGFCFRFLFFFRSSSGNVCTVAVYLCALYSIVLWTLERV